MTPMHQPIPTKKVNHSITVDGTDVEITRFVEFMYGQWFQTWQTLLNFSDVKYDLGHDNLRFSTESNNINLLKLIIKVSRTFPKLYMMYDYYTESDEEFEEDTIYLYNGEISDKDNGLRTYEV
jgi:hypothetical protein